MFAAFTLGSSLFLSYNVINRYSRPMIAVGAAAERVHLGPLVVFFFVWSTFVYDPIARWTWNPNGWSSHLGGLAFAGETPLLLLYGFAALAISIYLGIRPGINLRGNNYRPN